MAQLKEKAVARIQKTLLSVNGTKCITINVLQTGSCRSRACAARLLTGPSPANRRSAFRWRLICGDDGDMLDDTDVRTWREGCIL